MPIHHVLDDNLSDFAFGFKHFENFIAKQLFSPRPRLYEPEASSPVSGGGQTMKAAPL